MSPSKEAQEPADSIFRVLTAAGLPVLTVALGVAVYQLLMAPWIEAGNRISSGAWIALYGSIPISIVVAGASVSRISSTTWIAAITTVFRRTLDAVLVTTGAAGVKKLDVFHYDYWTWMLAIELCLWFAAASLGRYFRHLSRKRREAA